MAIDFDYQRYTLSVNVEVEGALIELAQISGQLPAQLRSKPADLLDAFAVMLRAGADRIEGERVLRSTFRSCRNGRARSVD